MSAMGRKQTLCASSLATAVHHRKPILPGMLYEVFGPRAAAEQRKMNVPKLNRRRNEDATLAALNVTPNRVREYVNCQQAWASSGLLSRNSSR